MQQIKGVCNKLLSGGLLYCKNLNLTQTCGLKYFAPPPNYEGIEIPEKARLRVYEKVPQYPPNLKAPKMQKRLRLMRGPEPIHNTLIHKQYGIVAKCGGRLRHEHFEMMRMGILRKLDTKRMFAVWRVDPPWQPITKKGQGQRMGGGKGAIDHYVTPIKANRIILEVAGKCEYIEVKRFLESVAGRLPFQAIAVSHEWMLKDAERQKQLEESNQNKYSMKYLIKNNMGGCHKWLSPIDHLYFGKYR